MLYGVMINKKFITGKREPFFEIAREYIGSNSSVLDIGCGNGGFSQYFNRKDFYLFDGNKKTCDFLRDQGHNNVNQGRLPDLPFGEKQFDVIHCSHVVEHLTPENFYATLKEMDRCLKTEGYLIISAPLMWEGFYDDLSHIRPYPPAVFKNYLCKNNKNNRSRDIIASNYIVAKEIYRYFEINPISGVVNSTNNFLVKLYILSKKMLKKIGLRKFRKTGFTIVLQKNE